MSGAVEVTKAEAKKPKASVEVRHNGAGMEFRYRPKEKVQKLLEEAIDAFGVAENVHRMALYTKEGIELKDELTLEAAGVKAGDLLRLRMSKVKGGAELAVGEGLLAQTLSTFRSCGIGRSECVAFWAGPISRPGLVDTFLHPAHSSGRGGYEVSDTWLTETWNRLDEECLAIRLQAHTHPRQAFHSAIDDSFPIIATPGFLSLVLPRFAMEPQTLGDAFLAQLQADGTFVQVEIAAVLGFEAPA